MDTETGKRLFQEAGAKFESGDYESALVHLRELDASYPDKRHILFPIVRSLAALGKYQEGIEINQRVIELFDYAPAKAIHADLQQKFMDSMTVNPDAHLQSEIPGHAIHTPSPSGLPDLNIQFTPPIQKAPPPLPRPSGTGRIHYVIWAALPILGFIALMGVTLTAGKPALEWVADLAQNTEHYESNPESIPPVPVGAYAFLWIAGFVYTYIISCWCGYWALRIMNALRFEDFGEDMKDIALYTLFCVFLSLIPVLGWIAALYVLNRHYELGFGRLLGVVVLFFVFNIGLSFVIGIAYWLIVFGAMAGTFTGG